MRRALLVAFLVLALSLGIVAVAGATTIQGTNSGSVSLQPAVSNAAVWVAEQSVGAGIRYAPAYHDGQCDHGDAAQDSSVSY